MTDHDDDFDDVDGNRADDIDDNGPDANTVDAANAVPAATARAVLDYVVRELVEHPDEVEVGVGKGRHHDLALEVRVASGDLGRVIGKRGRTAQAIRTVVRAAAVRDGVEVDVEFLE